MCVCQFFQTRTVSKGCNYGLVRRGSCWKRFIVRWSKVNFVASQTVRVKRGILVSWSTTNLKKIRNMGASIDGNRMFVSWPSARQVSFRVIFWPGPAFLLLRFLDDTQSERTSSTTPYRQIIHCHHVPLSPRAIPDSEGSIRQEGSRGHEYWHRDHHKAGIRRLM